VLNLCQKRLAENVPRTLDNMREHDPSMMAPEQSSAQATNESAADMAADPFQAHFTSVDDPMLPPKVLITTSAQACKSTYEFCDELVGVFPGAEFIRRKKGKGFELGRIAGWAANRGYKHLCVVNEDRKKTSAYMITRDVVVCCSDALIRCNYFGSFTPRANSLFQANFGSAH
jgi:ribosome production factor 1